MTRKRRTRQHIIESLSCNHLDKFIAKCGYSAQQIRDDYGIDLILFTYNRNGELENGTIGIQLKATDSIQFDKNSSVVHFRVERSHLEHWLDEPMPVILVVYDAKQDVAYWLYVQKYFESLAGFDRSQVGKEITVHIPVGNIVNEVAVAQFALFKQDILNQVRGVIRHA